MHLLTERECTKHWATPGGVCQGGVCQSVCVKFGDCVKCGKCVNPCVSSTVSVSNHVCQVSMLVKCLKPCMSTALNVSNHVCQVL